MALSGVCLLVLLDGGPALLKRRVQLSDLLLKLLLLGQVRVLHLLPLSLVRALELQLLLLELLRIDLAHLVLQLLCCLAVVCRHLLLLLPLPRLQLGLLLLDLRVELPDQIPVLLCRLRDVLWRE